MTSSIDKLTAGGEATGQSLLPETFGYTRFLANSKMANHFVEINEEMYKTLKLRARKKGEAFTPLELDKIYEYAIKHDLEVINRNDSYAVVTKQYLKERRQDTAYCDFVDPNPMGANGDFNEIDMFTMYNRWKKTSKPYGELAHKHYQQWKDALPAGPSVEFLRAQDQVQKVRQLWDDIRLERLEKTFEQIAIERAMQEEEEQKMNSNNPNSIFSAEELFTEDQRRQKLAEDGKFEELRKLPTQKQIEQSLANQWDK